jgi:hypothetical protein
MFISPQVHLQLAAGLEPGISSFEPLRTANPEGFNHTERICKN